MFKQGETLEVASLRINEGKTQAPGYLTESDLIAKMEENGIGTDASIPTHIKNIVEKRYAEVIEPGRQMKPTKLGYALVKGYCEIDPELVLPSVRSNIEKSCDLIAKGKADFSQVVNHVIDIFQRKYTYFNLSISVMESFFRVMILQGEESEKEDSYLKNKIALK